MALVQALVQDLYGDSIDCRRFYNAIHSNQVTCLSCWQRSIMKIIMLLKHLQTSGEETSNFTISYISKVNKQGWLLDLRIDTLCGP